MKHTLESIDEPNVMTKVAKLIVKLSKSYPDHTFYIFQDIIDILIAWHIDVTQTDELINTISDILVDFRPFWLKEINFTINYSTRQILLQKQNSIWQCSMPM